MAFLSLPSERNSQPFAPFPCLPNPPPTRPPPLCGYVLFLPLRGRKTRDQNLISRGEGCLVEARVCRVHRRQGTSELEAIRVSESLPFMVGVCDGSMALASWH